MPAPHSCIIIIVGGVAGGANAPTRGRRCNENAQVILYEKDGYASFANCSLPSYIGGEITERNNLFVEKPETFRDRHKSELHTRHEVTKIDPLTREVHVLDCDAGRNLYAAIGRLILAPGVTPSFRRYLSGT